MFNIASFEIVLLQLEVIVYDNAYPTDRGTATVTVIVDRNPSGPQFTDNLPVPFTYTRVITEDFPLGNTVIDINATDSDGVSSYTVSLVKLVMLC